ncbi:thioester reductase domain-containing protein [Variovorax sp. J22R133]|uniref:thioester reductase domain-containing protein n=1 Tax=Variovorax brevis TaxID=3053503 RepID=UPI0025761919|nr:thioester reductase domain-containing protein [Variovorax sp. J22R133]MDM0116497.1 thioester reductase domain-containing protein [Variovorax sp. J22R133]
MTLNVDTIYYLTPVQHGMLHHSQLAAGSGVYVEQFTCLLEGALDEERFAQAWAAVAQGHDVLKTRFVRLRDAQPLQVVLREVRLPLARADWSALDAQAQARRFEALLASDRAAGLDLDAAPLMRIQLMALGPQRWRFLWTWHHAILDGWSMPILLGEVFRHYAGEPGNGPPRPDFRHYAAWRRQQDMQPARTFWTDQLRGLHEALAWAPAVCPPPTQRAAGPLALFDAAMPQAWSAAAARLCRTQRITLNTLCQGAWSLLLALYGDSRDLCYGMVVSGRNAGLAGADAMVGIFINTVPMRVRLDTGVTAGAWLRDLQQDIQAAESHSILPLADIQQCSEMPRGQALFDTVYVFENYPGQAQFQRMVSALGLRVEDVRAVEQTHYRLALIVLPGDTLQFHFAYDPARFSAEAVREIGRQFAALLARLVDDGEVHVRQLALHAEPLPALPPPSMQHCAQSLLDCVRTHAARTPARLALVGGTATTGLSYGELLQRCEAAQQRWLALGFKPGERVVLPCDPESCDAQALVQLLSALALGLECIWAGASGDTPEGDYASLRLPGTDDAASVDGPDASRPDRGACWLRSQGEAGRRTLLRYTQQQLLQAAQAFAAACPVGTAHGMAFADTWSAGRALWHALMGLASGLSLHGLCISPGEDFVAQVALAHDPWHTVVLDPQRTRLLGEVPATDVGAIDCEHWIVDAQSLSARGAARLRALNESAAIVCEWHSPGTSLPHLRWQHADASTGPSALACVPGSRLDVIDMNGHPAAPFARGRLRISGASVPAAVMVRQALPGAAQGWTLDEPLHCVDAWPAWRTPQGFFAALAPEAGPTPMSPGRADASAALPDPSGDAIERGLQEIWSALLKRDGIQPHHNFFELGGQSLLAAVMLFQIEEKLGVAVEMARFFEAPTIVQLAQRIRSGTATRVEPDLAEEARLPADIAPPAAVAASDNFAAPSHVLLTGATGFLGAHLLAQLLANTGAVVHCLVRAPDATAALQRIVQAMQAQEVWVPAHAGRIVAVPGNLEQPQLGLDADVFDRLAQQIDAIYHNAALINFVYPYSLLKRVNVDATTDVLRLACQHHAKPVHYISTAGVLDRKAAQLDEVLALPLHDQLPDGYDQSKWVAEQRVAEAGRRGLPVTIYRPGRIVGSASTGRMNTDDLFCRLIKGIALFGKAPRGVGFDNVLPVDLVSRIIVEASSRPGARGQAVHVLNPHWHSFDEVVALIESRGYSLEHLAFGDWLEQLDVHVRRNTDHPLAMLIPALRRLNPQTDASVGRQLPISIHRMQVLAPQALAAGLQPTINWLKRCIEHFESSGYLTPPKSPPFATTKYT